MLARPVLLRRFLLPLLFAPALLLAEPAADTAVIPPEPPRPSLRGLSPEQQRQVSKSYRAAKHEWEKALPPAEKAKLDALNAAEDQELALRFAPFPDQEQEEKLIAQTLSMPWQESAVRAGLSPAEIEQLARDKVLIEDRQVAQSFSPYIDPERAVFVTTDSLLNGFHVLLSDSICELERHRSNQLRQHLEGLIPQVAGRASSLENAIQGLDVGKTVRHAGLVIGPAIVLLRGSLETIDQRDHPEILHQVELIRRAETQEAPAWLEATSSRTDTIDYRRFRPVGFYASDDNLADYFRAIRWLQTVPFRHALDHELLAAALLDESRSSGFCEGLTDYVETTNLDSFEPVVAMRFFLPYPIIARTKNPPFVIKIPAPEYFADVRRALRDSSCELLSFNSHDDTAGHNAGDPLQFAASRFLPSPPTGAGDQASIAAPPDGLVIAAAHNSAFARARLPKPAPPLEQLINLPQLEIPGAGFGFRSEYFNLIWAAAAPPDDAAPEFMKHDAWAAKSCLTVLAGWAQGQHRPTPQHHDSGPCDCDTHTLPGFVEPNAVFYSRLADLAAGTGEYFAGQGTSPAKLQERWFRLVRLATNLAEISHLQLRGAAVNPGAIQQFGHVLGFIMGYDDSSWVSPRDDAPRWAEVHRQPAADRGFAIGIGRPRLIHVLYPYEGREVLCTGSVMSYYEYWERDRLTDEQWKAKLDSPAAPPPPEWLTPFLAK